MTERHQLFPLKTRLTNRVDRSSTCVRSEKQTLCPLTASLQLINATLQPSAGSTVKLRSVNVCYYNVARGSFKNRQHCGDDAGCQAVGMATPLSSAVSWSLETEQRERERRDLRGLWCRRSRRLLQNIWISSTPGLVEALLYEVWGDGGLLVLSSDQYL